MELPILIINPVFTDNRGIFAPLPLSFENNKLKFLNKKWIQSNVSYNPKKLTLRGLHYQNNPYSQTKLVKVISGSIIDFAIDLRKWSENYKKCFIFEMKQGCELYVPKEFAHGFITTEDNTIVQYLVDSPYHRESESSIIWNSIPYIVEYLNENIKESLWSDNILISEKDSHI